MVSAIVLIDCEKGQVNATAEALASLDGVSEVYSVAGQVDLPCDPTPVIHERPTLTGGGPLELERLHGGGGAHARDAA